MKRGRVARPEDTMWSATTGVVASKGTVQRWRPLLLMSAILMLMIFAIKAATYPLIANPGPLISMTAQADPQTVSAGGLIDYTITFVNSGDQIANDLQIIATLPAGFSYVGGSTWVGFNGIESWWTGHNPVLNGQNLTWNATVIPDLRVPARRLDNYYGIHTFVQDALYDPHIETQLNKARELTGNGGYVTQLFYPVTTSTMGAGGNWKVFVQRACSKGLVPIVRLATPFRGSYWDKPTTDGALAQAFGRVVADLRTALPGSCTMYVQVLNETNLTIEWGGEWPDPIEYGRFLVQVSNAIRSLGDSRIRILNGALSPGGNYNNVSYTWEMLGVPGALWAWDAWATHPYPANHPAGYNIHSGTATYPELVIDSYILEMQQISKRGRHVYDVLATETGYRLTDSTYQFEGYPPINDDLRAGYIRDAFQNRWTNWPEFRASTPYELSDPSRAWWQFDWLRPDSYDPYRQYTFVRDIPYKPGFMPNGTFTLTFQARAGYTAGTQTLNVSSTASNATIAPASADVYVQAGGPSPTPTRTRTPTLTPVPGAPTPTSTATPTPEPTRTATPTPTATQTPLICIPTFLTSFTVGAHPKGIAVDSVAQRLHVGLYDSSQVAIFDTSTYAPIAQINTQGSHSNGVAVDPATGMVYVTNRDSANLSVINGRTAQYITRIGVGNLPFGVAAGGGRAYVANYGQTNDEGTVTTIDTTTNSVITTTRIGPRPALAAVGGGTGFVVSTGTDTGSGALNALSGPDSLASVPTGYFAFGVAYLDGKVYVTHRGDRTIVVIDAATNRVLDAITLPGPVYAAAANPNSGHIFAVDAVNNRVYVVDGPSGSYIAAIDVGTQDVDHGGQGIAVDTHLNRVFVGNYAVGSVSVIADCLPSGVSTPTATPTQTATRTATVPSLPSPTATTPSTPTPTIPAATNTATPTLSPSPTATVIAACTPSVLQTRSVGTHPKSMAVDTIGRRMHIGLFDGSQLLTLDADSLAVISTLDLAPLGSSKPNAVAVDQATGRVFVTSRDNANVAVVNGRTSTWETRVNVGNMPWGVAAADGRAYVANFADNTITVLDTSNNGVLGTIAAGNQPSLAAAGGGKGYVASFGNGSVTIVSLPSSVQQVSTGPEALGIAYMDGRIYVGSRAGQRLSAVDVASAQVVFTATLPGPVYAVAVNPVSGHLFAVDAANNRLYVLNVDDGRLVANLTVGQQDVNDGGQGLAVDPLAHRVYVTNYAAGSITAIDDCGPREPTPTATVTPTPGSYRFFLPVIMQEYVDEVNTTQGAMQRPTRLALPQRVGEQATSPLQGEGWGEGHLLGEPRATSLPVTGRSVAVDPVTGDIYIGQHSGSVAVLDGDSRSVSLILADGQRATAPGDLLAYNGRLYASYPAQGVVTIADRNGGQPLQVSGLARPFGLALDEQAGQLYVAEAGAEMVAVIDTDSGAVMDRIKVAKSPYILALDEAAQVLYVATPGDKSVWSISLAHAFPPQRVAVPGLGLVLGLTVDEKGDAFLVYAVSPKTRAIARLLPTGHTWGATTPVSAGYTVHTLVEGNYSLLLTESAGIVAASGRVYAADRGYLWGFDGETGDLATKIEVNATADTFGLAHDPIRRLIIVADARGGMAQVISQ